MLIFFHQVLQERQLLQERVYVFLENVAVPSHIKAAIVEWRIFYFMEKQKPSAYIYTNAVSPHKCYT